MDSTAEDLLAGFRQNNLWRYAALLTTGIHGGFFILIKNYFFFVATLTTIAFVMIESKLHFQNIFIRKNHFYPE
jgi:hypothetical protein